MGVILLSFTGWTSIGNSNWYMFTIISLYIMTYISFVIGHNKKNSLIINSLLTIIFVVGISFVKPSYWIDTALCYIAGMWYSYYLNDIDKFFLKYKKWYYFVLFGLLLIFALLFMKKEIVAIYCILSIVFCLIIVFVTKRVNINNKILLWIGNNLFWMYILQRLPMIIFSKLGINTYNSYIYFGLCFITTVVLAFIYSKLGSYLENLIFKNRKK